MPGGGGGGGGLLLLFCLVREGGGEVALMFFPVYVFGRSVCYCPWVLFVYLSVCVFYCSCYTYSYELYGFHCYEPE